MQMSHVITISRTKDSYVNFPVASYSRAIATVKLHHPLIPITLQLHTYRIAGNFRGEIFSWFSIIKFIRGKKFMVYSSVLSQLNHKIKSSWVKHSWFYLNHENHEIFSPRKFPAIRYIVYCSNHHAAITIPHLHHPSHTLNSQDHRQKHYPNTENNNNINPLL